jgi:hypothetical protein
MQTTPKFQVGDTVVSIIDFIRSRRMTVQAAYWRESNFVWEYLCKVDNTPLLPYSNQTFHFYETELIKLCKSLK